MEPSLYEKEVLSQSGNSQKGPPPRGSRPQTANSTPMRPNDYRKNYDPTQVAQEPSREYSSGKGGSLSQDEMQINMIVSTLRKRHEELTEQIEDKDSERNAIIDDINVLTQRLHNLNKSIVKKRTLFENYDNAIGNAEMTFGKITESTKALLSVVLKEQAALAKMASGKNH